MVKLEVIISSMYGFIYITTNHINGKKYIGQKKYDKYNHWKTYLGSGILLSRAINKYGRENFSKEIIEECETRDKLNAREKYWIFYHDAVNSDKLAMSEELEPTTQAELSFLRVGVVHKLRKIHMRGEWQQTVIHCLAAVFLRLDDVFLIVTATR